MLQSLTKPNTLDETEARSLVHEWQSALSDLERDVTDWAKEKGWMVTSEEITIEEDAFPFSYQVNALTIETDQGRLVLEPIARWVYGTRGWVDFYAYPSMVRIKLVRHQDADRWIARTDFGPNWPESWGKDTFYNLSRALLERP